MDERLLRFYVSNRSHICSRTQLPTNLGELSDTKVFFPHSLLKSMVTPAVLINHGYLNKENYACIWIQPDIRT